jgi:hypothetical protein
LVKHDPCKNCTGVVFLIFSGMDVFYAEFIGKDRGESNSNVYGAVSKIQF